jgi:hypothetical protein
MTGQAAETPEGEYLTSRQLAALLGMKPRSLEHWDALDAGPPGIRFTDGGKAPRRYLVTDVREWQASRRQLAIERRAYRTGRPVLGDED